MKNSGDSPSSRAEVAAVAGALTVLIAAFAYWLLGRGFLLYYGDAQAHLNISRSIFDSQAPAYDQWGTVWLPVLHFICLPFVADDSLWRTGLAGTIPVAACFVVAGTCFYLAAETVYQNAVSALAVLICFAANPNILYLASIPMTEVVFLAGLSAAFLAILRYRVTAQKRYLALGVLASWWMSLTRYDGWFLIPFLALLFARSGSYGRLRLFVGFGVVASLAPLCWMAHNWWETGNALDFMNGPYSAAAIQGDRPYPGWHNWPQALHYYFAAGKLCAGSVLLWLGFIGAFVALWGKRTRQGYFLLLTPAFYVWSLHSSKTPIHVPTLWPFSYYNTRYGIALVVFGAFAIGALVSLFPRRLRAIGAVVVIGLASAPWLIDRDHQNWICWKESEVNSVSRRAWTRDAADFLRRNYQAGDGVLASFGDITGIFPLAGIPLRETMHEGSHPLWSAAITAPDVYHPSKWAVALSGDRVSHAMQIAKSRPYTLVFIVQKKDAPALEIYRRN